MRLPGDVVDQRIGQQVRQVAHRGEHPVVLLGRQHMDDGAAAAPGIGHARHVTGIVFRQRRQHHLLAAVEVGNRGIRAVGLASGDRVARHELADALAHHGARRRHHVGLGAAGVGDDGVRFQMRQQRGQDRARLRHRRRQQHQVGAGSAWRGSVAVSSTMPSSSARFKACSERSSPTMARAAGRLQAQRERAADQADADDDDLFEHQASAFFSASTKAAFSCGRPIEMRSHCGRP
jgi:hypothetical protein